MKKDTAKYLLIVFFIVAKIINCFDIVLFYNSRKLKICASAVAIALLIFSIRFYFSQMAALSFLDAEGIAKLLDLSETTIFWASIFLIGGLVGEYFDGERWKESTLYTVAKLSVVFAVFVELLGTSAEFRSADKLHDQDARKIQSAENIASDGLEKAQKAEQEQRNLLEENIDLERAIAPRTIDQGALAEALADFPRHPIFISSVDKEEPKDTAAFIMFSFSGIKIRDTLNWSVQSLPPQNWPREAIDIQYVGWPSDGDVSVKGLAETICKSLKAQGIAARTEQIGGPQLLGDWPNSVPKNALIIRVGEKPNHFWLDKLLKQKGMEPVNEMYFCDAAEFFNWGRDHRKIPLK